MFRWTEADGMRNLGVIAPGSDSDAQDVNGDGSVIVGRAYFFESQMARALLWTAGIGLVDLNTYLPSLGIDLSGWVLVDAVGVSDDGRTITGLGVHDGSNQAWVATLPSCAADFNHDFVLNSQDFFDYLSAYFTADPRADFNHDGTIDSTDFFQYVTEFLAGCGG
jgi:hypothetical protein